MRRTKKGVVTTDLETPDKKTKSARVSVLKNGLIFDESKYEYSDEYVPGNPSNPLEVQNTAEMIECLKRNKNIQLDARVVGMTKDGPAMARMNRESFLEAAKQKESKKLMTAARQFREGNGFDGFGWDDMAGGYGPGSQGGGALIGYDFTPLLGGPFNKQLYYRDMLRQMSTCFFAFHHDPVARDIVSIITDFTMGRGFTVKTDNKAAQILWDAFSEANDLPQQMDFVATELSVYGEIMLWWLPHHQTRISFNPVAGEKVPTGILPRVRLIDPSNIAEIITVPEDMIKGVLYYVWLAPTQYQMYTRDNQPSTKFIYTQIPADQINHYKINCMSNEKRGRSDYFPALGYMKRLRDSVNYAVVAQQKASAWSIDTTIKGNDEDITSYIQDQLALGPIPPAGSEFVHTEAITRQYLSNSAAKGGDNPSFNWCLNMICMAAGVPMQYLGTHLSGGNNRASALVSTEPVAKKFERRRGVYERIIKNLFDTLMRKFNISAECEVTFPELITQDRSTKLRDLMIAQNNGWLSQGRVAEIASKEFDITDYDYKLEQEEIKKEKPNMPEPEPTSTSPLTSPGKVTQTDKSGSMTSPEKKQVKDNLKRL